MKKIFFSTALLLIGALISVSIIYATDVDEKFDVGKRFPDVDYDSWYGTPVAWARAARLITGYPNGNFGPHDPMTRAQMVTILKSYEDYVQTRIGTLNFLVCTAFEGKDTSKVFGHDVTSALMTVCGIP